MCRGGFYVLGLEQRVIAELHVHDLMDKFERDAGCLEKSTRDSMLYSVLCKCDALLSCPMPMHQSLYTMVTLLDSNARPSSVL